MNYFICKYLQYSSLYKALKELVLNADKNVFVFGVYLVQV